MLLRDHAGEVAGLVELCTSRFELVGGERDEEGVAHGC